MPAKHSRHIALTASLAEWVDSQVSNGDYTSASDLIRSAIRLLKDGCEYREAEVASKGSHLVPAPKRV